MATAAARVLDRCLADHVERALHDSPRARELCGALSGRRLWIELRGTPLAVLVSAHEQTLRIEARALHAAPSPPADVSLAGTPLALLAVVRAGAEAQLAAGQLTLSGDQALASQFQALLALLSPELETTLAAWVGRIPAHLATRGLAALGAWTRAAGDSLLRNGADYLAFESRDLLPRAEAEGFLSGVAALARQIGQLEARVTRAEAALPPASAAATSGAGAARA
jgi:ubiquinone biosynthesis protein UbiJ